MKDVDITLGRETGAAGNPSPLSRDLLSVTPSANSNGRYSESPGQLVYAVGQIGYEFVSHSRRDSIRQKMLKETQDQEETKRLFDYLGRHPDHASAIQWRLELDEGTPIYVIEPCGAFASNAYDKLREYLLSKERVAIPGVISGKATDRSGLALPVVAPEIRGMRSWTKKEVYSNFLERVYYEFHNLGREPKDRALNFVATEALAEVENAYKVKDACEKRVNGEIEKVLETIKVERSPVGRPGSDCWDVKLIFFYCEPELRAVRKLCRVTVDVTDVVPALVGSIQSWLIPESSV